MIMVAAVEVRVMEVMVQGERTNINGSVNGSDDGG